MTHLRKLRAVGVLAAALAWTSCASAPAPTTDERAPASPPESSPAVATAPSPAPKTPHGLDELEAALRLRANARAQQALGCWTRRRCAPLPSTALSEVARSVLRAPPTTGRAGRLQRALARELLGGQASWPPDDKPSVSALLSPRTGLPIEALRDLAELALGEERSGAAVVELHTPPEGLAVARALSGPLVAVVEPAEALEPQPPIGACFLLDPPSTIVATDGDLSTLGGLLSTRFARASMWAARRTPTAELADRDLIEAFAELALVTPRGEAYADAARRARDHERRRAAAVVIAAIDGVGGERAAIEALAARWVGRANASAALGRIDVDQVADDVGTLLAASMARAMEARLEMALGGRWSQAPTADLEREIAALEAAWRRGELLASAPRLADR